MATPLFAEGGSFSSGIATDTSSNLASSGSTPPTTVADSASLHSDTSKHDVITVADDAADAPPAQLHEHEHEHEHHPPETSASASASTNTAKAPAPPSPSSPARRTRRARASTPVYNLAKLSGTDGHGKRRANGDMVADRRRRTISGDTLVGSVEVAAAAAAGTPSSATRRQNRALKAGIDALQLQWSPAGLDTPRTRRQARQLPGAQRASAARFSGVSSLGSKLSTMGRRGRRAVDKGVAKMSRELRRLQDTNEFTGVDERPVVHTVWSNGKYVDPKEPAPPAREKAKVEPAPEPDEDEAEPITNTRKRRVKKYLDKGLYAGQDAPLDMSKGLTTAEKKKLAQLPELIPSGRVNKTMPLPIYTGLRMLLAGRDFKLPYQICNPLPPGQPKPDEWKKMTKSMSDPPCRPLSVC